MRIIDVDHVHNYVLELVFSDGHAVIALAQEQKN
ncbi:DUF971 domain-containing protein [Idiomarina sp. A28L]|nr:DUF971 domain-containing protein [Idiomarina sp. A28L]